MEIFSSQNLILILSLVGVFLFGFSWLFYFYLKRLKRHQFGESWNNVLLQIKVPKESLKEEKIQDPREITKIIGGQCEQFFSALWGIYRRGTKRFLFGQNCLTLEIAATSKKISFYLGVPKDLIALVEKQTHSFWPEAQIEITEDYNIFRPDYETASAYLQLEKKYYYPLKTYKFLETDPLSSITNSLSKLEEGEGAAIQITIQPEGKKWQEKTKKAALAIHKGPSKTPSYTSFLGHFFHPQSQQNQSFSQEARRLSPQEEMLIEALGNKASKVGFRTALRIITSASTKEKSESLLSNIASSFAQFNAPSLNSFKFKQAKNKKEVIDPYIFRIPSSKTMILNSEELSTLFHFPSPLVETPNIDWLRARFAPPPSNLPAEGIVLGKSVYRGLSQLVRIKDADRRRHLYLIGKTGTGKSTFLEYLILQDIRGGKGLCVVDPHGDLIESILPKIPQERAEDVILFDPGDRERPLALNLFEFKRDYQKHFLIQEAINMLYKLYDPGHTGIMGPRFERWFRNASLTAMADPEGAIFFDPAKMFIDDDFLQKKLRYVTDPQIKDFWYKEMAQTSDFHKSEVLGWFTAKFDAFMTDEIMRNILGQTHSAFDFREVMDQGKILLVNLSRGKIGELNSMLLGMIFVAKLQAAAMSRVDVPEEQRKDFYLYVDEFQNFTTDSFATILSEARKYHLSLITANQYIGQLEEHVREAVFGNVGTLVAFTVGPADADFLVKEYEPVFSAEDLVNIDKFKAYLKLLIDYTSCRPFSVQTIKDETESNKERGEKIRELSSMKYGRSREEVEREIFERWRPESPEITEEISEDEEMSETEDSEAGENPPETKEVSEVEESPKAEELSQNEEISLKDLKIEEK